MSSLLSSLGKHLPPLILPFFPNRRLIRRILAVALLTAVLAAVEVVLQDLRLLRLLAVLPLRVVRLRVLLILLQVVVRLRVALLRAVLLLLLADRLPVNLRVVAEVVVAAVEVHLKMKESGVLEVEAAVAVVGEEQEGPLKSAQVVEEAGVEEAVAVAVARLHCSAMSATLVQSTQALEVAEAGVTSASQCCPFSIMAKAAGTPSCRESPAVEAEVGPSA